MNKDSFLYLQIYNDIKMKIENHVYIEGMRIPSDEELMNSFGVSMITVKKALSILKNENLLQRIPGVGTFVKRIDRVQEEKVSNAISYKKLGLILEHVSSSFGLDLLYAIDQKANALGYKVITRFSYFNRDKETQEIDFLIQSGVEGLIIMPCHGLYYNPILLKLILDGFPVVVVDKKLEGISVPTVCTDNKQAIKVLVKDLKDKGCSNIGFVSIATLGTSSLYERRIGFYEGVEEYGFTSVSECSMAFDEHTYQNPPSETNVNSVVEYLLKNGKNLDGIVCAEYSLMATVLEAIKKVELEEGSIKLCCVDGPQELAIPHMKQNEYEMAEKIISVLVNSNNEIEEEKDFLIPALFLNN